MKAGSASPPVNGFAGWGGPWTLLPVGVVGQFLGDPVVEALAAQGRLDVGHDPADRIRDLVLDVGYRRLVASCGSAAVSGGLAAQAFAGLGSVWLLYALVAVSSSLSAINAPVRRTFVPTLLPADQLTAGLALQRLTFQIMLTAGPALAGLITATPGLGLRGCYLIDAASFGCSLYGVAGLPVLPRTAGAARPGLRAVTDGVRFIGQSRILLGAFLADLNATIFGLPVALFPAINAERFGGDPRTLGLFTAAIGVGGLVTAALSGPVGRIERQGRAMLGAVAIWGAARVHQVPAPAPGRPGLARRRDTSDGGLAGHGHTAGLRRSG